VVPAAVVLGRETEVARIRSVIWTVGRSRSADAREGDELGHLRSEAIALVGLVDVLGDRQRILPIREHRREGRLVRDERADPFGMPGHQRERVHGSPAAAEDVHRPGVELGDQPASC
jgi:hypothetical protein